MTLYHRAWGILLFDVLGRFLGRSFRFLLMNAVVSSWRLGHFLYDVITVNILFCPRVNRYVNSLKIWNKHVLTVMWTPKKIRNKHALTVTWAPYKIWNKHKKFKVPTDMYVIHTKLHKFIYYFSTASFIFC
jgi:hypothetical protein